MEKENRRVTMTRKMLKDALIRLLKEKSIYRISIRELCELADVNRTTFYKYYGSQFDLLYDMESDVIRFISETVDNDRYNIEAIIVSLCGYLENNLEFARLLITNNIDPQLPEKLFSLEAIRTIFQKNLQGRYDATELEYLYNYITYGAFRVVTMWLNKEQREPPEKLASMIMRIVV